MANKIRPNKNGKVGALKILIYCICFDFLDDIHLSIFVVGSSLVSLGTPHHIGQNLPFSTNTGLLSPCHRLVVP